MLGLVGGCDGLAARIGAFAVEGADTGRRLECVCMVSAARPFPMLSILVGLEDAILWRFGERGD